MVVVIVAHRHGWEPPGQPPSRRKSITRLECEQAVSEGKEILAFLVAPDFDWPASLKETHDATTAMEQGKGTPEFFQDVQRRVVALREFRAWLDGLGVRRNFTTPTDLGWRVSEALHEWLKRHPEFELPSERPEERAQPADPARYLKRLREQTQFINIRGLQVRTGKAYRFPIQDLFISLTTKISSVETRKLPEVGARARNGRAAQGDPGHPAQCVPLHHALSSRRLVVMGDPGAGKTTFLRYVAFALCESLLGEVPNAAETRLGLKEPPFPIFATLAEFAEHISTSRAGASPSRPTTATAAEWLPHFLASVNQSTDGGLAEGFFGRRLQSGSSLLLLDGLDELPDDAVRARMSRLIENVGAAYERCTIVVTTRPVAYSGEVVLPGFDHVWIDALSDESVNAFLERWCEALCPGNPADARAHSDELLRALARRPDIRRMARNPVMLTALAVVHWNERRLPEQRSDLYESILRWLARSREPDPGRPNAERCLALLAEVALAMQCHSGGRRAQVTRRWAAEALLEEFDPATGLASRPPAARGRLAEADRLRGIEAAEAFIKREEADSGIVVGRGNEIRFWHLTFQEFLAARAIAGRGEKRQQELLLGGTDNLYRSDWREVVLLLASILHAQGRDKTDGLVAAVLDALGDKPGLASQARCAGVLGALVRDLRPGGYDIPDVRYARLLDTVLGIFQPEKSRTVSVKDRIEAAEALGQAGDPRLEEANWVTIPAGVFAMGAQKAASSKPNYDSDADDDEAPVREVSLDAYQIARFPVTVFEYGGFLEADGYSDRRWWEAGGFGDTSEPQEWEDQRSYPNRPVVGVSWFEAAAYCRWKGVRLPTEAEWERAARGTEGRKYPWGNEPADPERLNYSESHLGRPTPIGIYPLGATPEGVLDMAGNVWEWVHDWYAPHSATTARDPRGPEAGSIRVLRGGSWWLDARFCRSAFRYYGLPAYRYDFIGFRPARSLPQAL